MGRLFIWAIVILAAIVVLLLIGWKLGLITFYTIKR